MEVVKIIIILIVTITMALSMISTTLTMKKLEKATMKRETTIPIIEATTLPPSRSLSRFLAEKNPRSRGSQYCEKKKKNMCERKYGKAGGRWECCKNKCVDLRSDKHNCGRCNKKCKYTAECCRGQCVDVAYDKRHCGRCNNACLPAKFCVYGMCEYA